MWWRALWVASVLIAAVGGYVVAARDWIEPPGFLRDRPVNARTLGDSVAGRLGTFTADCERSTDGGAIWACETPEEGFQVYVRSDGCWRAHRFERLSTDPDIPSQASAKIAARDCID